MYVYLFEDKCAYVGLTDNFKQRLAHRKINKNDAVIKHIKRTGYKAKFKILKLKIPYWLEEL